MKKEEDENAAEVPVSAQTAGIRLPGEVKTLCEPTHRLLL